MSHPLIRCSKEDFSLIQILTDIDSVSTINKFQSTAHTELELLTTKETVLPLSTETKEEPSTTSQTPRVDQSKTQLSHGPLLQLLVLPADMLTLIQILLMSNQELSGIKFSLRNKERLSLTTYLDLSALSPTDLSKKVSSLTSIRSTQTMETDLPKLLMFQLTKLDYEIF